jgi:ATP-binding cassette, subfamily C, bacterial LapB
MDNATETMAMESIAQLTEGQSVVLVTHKLQLLNFVERIMVLDAGLRVADGPKLVVMQALSEGKVRGANRPVELPAGT